MTLNARAVGAILKASGLTVGPIYLDEGLYVANVVQAYGREVTVRAIGRDHDQLAEAATVLLEHAGYVVEHEGVFPSARGVLYARLTVTPATCPSCAEAERIGLRDTLAEVGITMTCDDCGTSDTVVA
jgi:hypothetical protein